MILKQIHQNKHWTFFSNSAKIELKWMRYRGYASHIWTLR